MADLEAMQEELEEAHSRVSRLEEALADREARLATLEQESGERLKQIAERYRKALLMAHPAVPAELVKGASLEEIDASLEAAQATVEAIRQRLEAEASAEHIPAGAPPRTPPDLRGLSPREKIIYGLERGERQ